MKLIVRISLKKSILDPQGEAISNSLKSLGFSKLNSVRQGKILELDLEETDPDCGVKIAKEMCEKLLVNSVIENYSLEIE
ncbi:MAG: phosphoribosylformylglycinamidine synthase subunit PurS [Paracoccaceae bacterium]|nr:phosphoribosylformylglycinamidine synthase subunit PurS [Paracoccaceae bacterium]